MKDEVFFPQGKQGHRYVSGTVITSSVTCVVVKGCIEEGLKRSCTFVAVACPASCPSLCGNNCVVKESPLAHS